MLPVAASSVMSDVRAFLNDTEGQNFTDDIILPYLRVAYSDLKMEMADYNIPITNKTTEPITILAGVKNIGGVGGPALPNDLIEIFDISERTGGTSNDFLRMSRKQFLPETEQITAYLQVWSWQDQIIKFLGATGTVEVKINYIGMDLGTILNESSTIRAYNAASYLGYRTAGHCALYIGENESRAQVLYGEAATKLDIILNLSIKNQQSIRTRRMPFRARRKANSTYSQ